MSVRGYAGDNVGSRESRYADLVRPRGIGARIVGRQEGTALKYEYASRFPAAYHAVNETVTPAEKFLPFAERQFIEIGRQEPVTPVVDHVSVVEAWMKAIGEPIAAGGHESCGISASFV